MRFKTYKLFLKAVTPVHIGNGEEYEPFAYVVKNGKMYLIDEKKFADFMKQEGKSEDFLKVCETGNILKIRSFIYRNFKESTSFAEIEVSPEFEKLYNKNIENTASNQHKIINQLVVMKTQKNSFSYLPIIPGSSIKGAIRTAILDTIAKLKQKPEEKFILKNNRQLESYLLNYLDVREKDDKKFYSINVKKDPLKFLKISDFTLVKGGTIVDKVTNIQRFGSDRDKVYQFLELIKPGSIFEGTISIEESFALRFGREVKTITLKELINLSKAHYLDDVYQKETHWFNYKQCGLKDFETDFVLKLGMHTGAYAMTISEYRSITLRFGGKPKHGQKHQTTTWKAESFNLPLGWVVLSNEEFKKNNSINERKTISEGKTKPASKESLDKLLNKFGGK